MVKPVEKVIVPLHWKTYEPPAAMSAATVVASQEVIAVGVVPPAAAATMIAGNDKRPISAGHTASRSPPRQSGAGENAIRAVSPAAGPRRRPSDLGPALRDRRPSPRPPHAQTASWRAGFALAPHRRQATSHTPGITAPLTLTNPNPPPATRGGHYLGAVFTDCGGLSIRHSAYVKIDHIDETSAITRNTLGEIVRRKLRASWPV